MSVVIKVENLSKQYRLGETGTGALSHDLKRWWYTMRGKEDPFLKIGEINDRTTKAESDYVWALQDINFEVNSGEVLGIIGKNGAGKSTLLKILSKTTSPTTGSVKIKGRIASLLEVGTGFHPELTGRENIFLNGAILGMTKREIQHKFDEIVDFSGVEKYIDTPVKRYSSGMYVRLAFAVAAHLEPDILIVDEVLAVGDAEFQKKCLGKMQDVSRNQGRTVLFVSHNMAAVQNLCNKGILIDKGKIHINGTISSVINEYSNLFFANRKNNELTHTRRIGDKRVELFNLEIRTHSSDEVTNIKTGSEINFHLTLLNNLFESKKIFIAIAISNQIDERVLYMSNKLKPYSITLPNKKSFSVNFKMNKNPLVSGNYTLTYYISIDEIISDWSENVLSFTVLEGDFFNSGILYPSSNGYLVQDFEVII